MHAIVTPAVSCKMETFSIKGQDPVSCSMYVQQHTQKKLFANSLLFFVGCKDPDFYGDLKLSKLHANLNYRLDVCTRHCAIHLGWLYSGIFFFRIRSSSSSSTWPLKSIYYYSLEIGSDNSLHRAAGFRARTRICKSYGRLSIEKGFFCKPAR